MLLRSMTRLIGLAAMTASLMLAGCGDKKKKGGGGGAAPVGTVEREFQTAAATATGISPVPVRMLMAVAYLESGLSPQNAQAKYVNLTNTDEAVYRGTLMTQTAFGLTFEQLGLDPNDEASGKLETQINAYAVWLATNVKDLGLSQAPTTPSEKYAWINNLALLHRKGVAQRRNVEVVFARELINILNQGFVWQNPENGEILNFPAERPAIDPATFPVDGQQWFSLDVQDGQFLGIDYLRLATTPTDEITNHPKRIEVIHCPLSLSACLELQTRNAESDVHIAAHYVVPQDKSIFDYVVQVADHREAVVLTDNRGVDVPINDRIVIMLVGNSGRNVQGTRMPAIPTWFSSEQLKTMGRLINDVCKYLETKTPKDVKYDECISLKGDKGVHFREQGSNEEYRWGEIADFDPTIFEAYVKNYAGLDTEVRFQLSGNNKTFRSGSNIPLTLLFNAHAKKVELERLSRCSDGKVVWEPMQTIATRAQTSATSHQILYDAGPNRNGDQFFRARVYGDQGDLIGWTIDRVVLQGYEPKETFASDEYCRF